jgi:hypothetical protein
MSQITRHHSASSFPLDKEKDETEISQHVALEDLHLIHMSPDERTAAFALARELDPGPPVFSWRYLNFFMSIVVVLVCSCDSGFDSTIMSSVNSMTQFQDYFGLISASTGTGILFVSPLVPMLSAEELEGRAEARMACGVWLTNRVFTLSARSAPSSPISSSLIFSVEGGVWWEAILCSCTLPFHHALGSADPQDRRHHLCQRQGHADAAWWTMVDGFRVYHGRPQRESFTSLPSPR